MKPRIDIQHANAVKAMMALEAAVHREFSEEEIANLTLAVVAINGWNRFAISFRAVPGEYVSPYGKKD